MQKPGVITPGKNNPRPNPGGVADISGYPN